MLIQTENKDIITNMDEALDVFDLNFEIDSHEIMYGEDSVIHDSKAITRTDTGKYLGIVGKGYPIISPKTKFEALREYVDQGVIGIIDGGNTGKNEGVSYLQTIIKDSININPKVNDITECRVTFTTSSNGMKSNEILLTPYRLACSNGMIVGDMTKKKKKRVKNSMNLEKRLPDLSIFLEEILHEYRKLDDFLESCFKSPELNDKQINGFIEKLFAVKKTANNDYSTRTKNRIDDIKNALFEGVGQDIVEKKNLYWLLNGVTCWTNNYNATKKDDPFHYIMYGQGERFNTKGFNLVSQAMSHGNSILEGV